MAKKITQKKGSKKTEKSLPKKKTITVKKPVIKTVKSKSKSLDVKKEVPKIKKLHFETQVKNKDKNKKTVVYKNKKANIKTVKIEKLPKGTTINVVNKVQVNSKTKSGQIKKLSFDVWRPSKNVLLITSGIIVLCLIVLLTVAAFFDWQISVGLAQWSLPNGTIPIVDAASKIGITGQIGQVYTNNTFAQIIEIVGTAPCILVTICALAIFYWNSNRISNQNLRRFSKIGMVSLSIGWNIYACFFQFFPLFIVSIVGVDGYAGFGPLSGSGSIANAGTTLLFVFFGLVIGVLSTSSIFFMFRNIKKQTMSELLRWAFIVSSASLASIFLIEIVLKPTLQRERFRFIYAFKNVGMVINLPGSDMTGAAYSDATYGGFHPWYALPVSPKAFQEGNLPFISEDVSKSFPSGHETMAACGFLSLILLPLTVTQCNTKKIKNICIYTAILGTLIVALGRIMAGAHYLSDVTMGSFIAFGFLVIFYFSNVYGSKFLDRWTGLQIVKR